MLAKDDWNLPFILEPRFEPSGETDSGMLTIEQHPQGVAAAIDGQDSQEAQ